MAIFEGLHLHCTRTLPVIAMRLAVEQEQLDKDADHSEARRQLSKAQPLRQQ